MMAEEGFRLEGIVVLEADEKSIEALADDADRKLSQRPTARGTGSKTSPVASGRSVGRDALAGAGGATFAKQVGGEVGKAQQKTARAAGGLSPVAAGVLGANLIKGTEKPREDDRGRRRGSVGFQRGVVTAAATGNLKGGLLSVLKSGPFLAATAVVGAAVISAAIPKLIPALASKRLDRLVGLPGSEFSPELSALALQRTIRQRLRTQEVGRIRGGSATALAQTTDDALDRLARIGAGVGVAVDRILKYLIETLSPILELVEFALRKLNLIGPGTAPGSLNMPINLLFGSLRARALNPVPPIPVIS